MIGVPDLHWHGNLLHSETCEATHSEWDQKMTLWCNYFSLA